MTCHLGDFEEYARLRRELKDRETELARQGAGQRRAAAAGALEKLKPGDIIHVPTGKYAGLALVLDPGLPAGRANGHRGFEHHDGPRPLVLTAERQVKRLAAMDFPVPVEALERMRIPKSFNPRQPAVPPRPGLRAAHQGRAHRARAAPQAAAPRPPTTARSPGCAPRSARHPCHGCDEREDHARWAERYHRLQRDTRQLERRIEGRTNTIARTFDRIVRAAHRARLPAGRRGHRATAGGSPGSTASWTCWPASACATGSGRASARPNWPPASRRWSTSRGRPTTRWRPSCPSGAAKAALGEMVRIWGRLDALEEDHRISQTEGVGQREPDLGFAWAAYLWASGQGPGRGAARGGDAGR